MAVPKKRTSKSKKKTRKAVWTAKADKAAVEAFSRARSVLTGRSSSFYYAANNDISK
uniref:Large ribosomal subunit protein bL32c n=4 Tax=Huperzia TaxID=37428 RepID=RK32_HUPLU|nr:ribosomal protein L32 [Huperzia serrata]YP_010424529.1 ribosomal protein L32 [Huperzia crispata]YP_011031893.1 ribosomal protein L32 [Huperzia selago]YP_011031980.1 ribosomal protein L32 [Huperzia kunmingensis]YP_209569.1 ribosomal protein L32 [Huperzia lucidula]Q5SD01.1 RecName: Full=Large ribosomal subunit protein bL32c; AltName: Full=50S ribosomal protein L32, chloroplastic [Huperzia lucidula]ATV96618.1 ribosomal protein L32 [Huperzia serrata f. longipetiolata]WRB00917.1 ribosomal prot